MPAARKPIVYPGTLRTRPSRQASVARMPGLTRPVRGQSRARGSRRDSDLPVAAAEADDVATATRGRDEAEAPARLDAWNQPIHRARGRIKKIFRTWKRSYGLRRIRFRGLAKAAIQIGFTAIARNLKRTMNIVAAARTPQMPGAHTRRRRSGFPRQSSKATEPKRRRARFLNPAHGSHYWKQDGNKTAINRTRSVK